MEHVSLYRKWRPRSFEEVVGQGPVTTTLANALSSGRLVHAYLFAGPRGTGKTSTARILAKAINCVEGPTATPCNECEACMSVSDGTAMDVIEIDAASNRKIDEIRELLEKIPYMPTSLRTKVYIIDEVHQLTAEASSALLKTLEEPPGHIVFVLATTEPHKLLPTIVSRCQRYDFSQVSPGDIALLLEHIAGREGIDVEREALEMMAEHAQGSVRDAIGVMDQISNLGGETVTKSQLSELLGEVESEVLSEAVAVLAERDTAAALDLVARVVDGGKDPRRFVESLIGHLRNIFLIQNASNPREIVEATADHLQRLSDQSAALSRHEVIRLMESFGAAHRDMRWSENPRLVLEIAVVRNTSLDSDISLEGLAFRVEELERALAATGPAVPGEARAAPGTERPAARGGAGRGVGKAKDKPLPGAVAPEPGPGPGQAAGDGKARAAAPGAERERLRRGWMAVMGELKKAGQMKLYALLTRARIQSADDGRLLLAFPGDALFQMEVLAGSETDRAAIEEAWERFVGQKVHLEFVSAERPASGGDNPGEGARAPASRVPPAGEGDTPARTREKSGRGTGGRPGPRGGEVAEERRDGPGVPGAAGGKGTAREVAERLRERFDGEIIADNKEGKD